MWKPRRDTQYHKHLIWYSISFSRHLIYFHASKWFVFIFTLLLSLHTSVSVQDRNNRHCSSDHKHIFDADLTEKVIDVYYSTAYPIEETCEWLINGSQPGHVLRISVTDLSTECSWDQLHIFDGNSFRNQTLGVFSGTLTPRSVYARSGQALIYFFSDLSGVSSGFKIRYSLVNESYALSEGKYCTRDSDCNEGGTCSADTKMCSCWFNKGYFCTFPTSTSKFSPAQWHLLSFNSDLAVSRTGHTAVLSQCDFCGSKVWIFGGYDLKDVSNKLYASSTAQYTFQEVNAVDIFPPALYGHQMAAQKHSEPLFTQFGVESKDERFGEESLFIHGGILADGELSSELWQYRIRAHVWVKLASSPLAVADHVMVIVDNRWLFIHGGRSNATTDNPISDMFYYDTKQHEWIEYKPYHGYSERLRLAGHSAIYYPDETAIYIYGGYTQQMDRFLDTADSLWKFYIKERVWSELEPHASYSIPPPLVWHKAVYSAKHKWMVLYGGQTKGYNCLANHIAVFDLNCQSWLPLRSNISTSQLGRSLGQLGHAMVVDDDVLYVYGGVQGSLTHDVIATHVSLLVSESGRSCDPCRVQTSCAACTLLSSRAGCVWCPKQEKRCISADRDSCDKSVTWGDNLPLSTLEECKLSDSPSGWYYFLYKYPANYTQPDQVLHSLSAKFSWLTLLTDYRCATCYNEFLAQGWIVNLPARYNISLTVVNTGTNGLAFTEIDDQQTLIAEVVNPVLQKTEHINMALLRSGHGYMKLMTSHPGRVSLDIDSVVWLGVIPLLTSDDTIPYQYLRPYTASSCSSHLVCMTCAADINCGWCDVTSSCISRSSSASCDLDGDWLVTEPQLCSNCTDYTDCRSCTTSKANCEWVSEWPTTVQNNNKLSCVRRGRFPNAVVKSKNCDLDCHKRDNCSSCLSDMNECIWCSTLQTCLPMDEYLLTYPYGQCLYYTQSYNLVSSQAKEIETNYCSPCTQHKDCNSCHFSSFCGWCSHDADPSLGICVSGDFSSPANNINCSEAIAKEHKVEGPSTWSFRTCPDLKECSLGKHNCVEHAECVETLQSYECHCERGYIGVGNQQCNKTCYHNCIHGYCRELPLTDNSTDAEFECSCDRGWTGPDCNTDCGCNGHSTCSTSVGSCDYCHPSTYTTGQFCDVCVKSSFGNATNPQIGCRPCDCNGHGAPDLECHRQTGVCNCRDNTMGDRCSSCMPGYFGDPRNGGECFKCYFGRSVNSSFRLSAAFSSKACPQGFADTKSYLWTFSVNDIEGSQPTRALTAVGNSSVPGYLVFELVSIPENFLASVKLFTATPKSLLSRTDDNLLATLTYKDAGKMIVSSNGYLAVSYYAEHPRVDVLTFRVHYRNTTECPDGKTGPLCDRDIHCRTSNSTPSEVDCGVQMDDLRLRHISSAANTPATSARYLIHGGVDVTGALSYDFTILDMREKKVLGSNSTGAKPSARYGHAMTCLLNACYLYGGVAPTVSNSASDWLSLPEPLSDWSISSQFWEYGISTDEWKRISQKVVPKLSGHTMTSVVRDMATGGDMIVLIGGLLSDLSWNTLVYVWSGGSWRIQATSGYHPKYGLIDHHAVYHSPDIYVIPRNSFRSADSSLTMYLLNTYTWRWSITSQASHSFNSTSSSLRSSWAAAVVNTEDFMYLLEWDTRARSRSSGHRLSVLAFSYKYHVWTQTNISPVSGWLSDGVALSYSWYDQHLYILNAGPADAGSSKSYISTAFLNHRCFYFNWTYCMSKSECRVDLHFNMQFMPTCVPTDVEHSLVVNPTRALDEYIRKGYVYKSPDLYCNDKSSCELCTSNSQYYSSYSTAEEEQCLWCDTSQSCLSLSNIEALSATHRFTCYGGAYPHRNCSTDPCSRYGSCASCVENPKCQWQVDGDIKFYLTGRCVLSSSYVAGTESNQICPSPCNQRIDCKDCLTNPVNAKTHSNCLWNPQENLCLDSQFRSLLDITHIGQLISDAQSCLIGCSQYTSCLTCLAQAHCGWLSDDDTSGSGTGNCVESHQQQEATAADSTWKFLKCPPENECVNGHHTCDEQVERCVDEKIGFRCECRGGYTSVTKYDSVYNSTCLDLRPTFDPEIPDTSCVPVCQSSCGDHGCCSGANQCQCSLGHVGNFCEKTCDCNGHSDCLETDLTKCKQCLHNTTGSNCQFCLPGFVGNPREGDDCIPCREVCNNKSSVCIRSEKEEENSHGPLSSQETVCIDCGGNSRGSLCDECEKGYFLSLGTCVPCMCNGHGSDNRCNTDGSSCDCRNNTRSSNSKLSTRQCDQCQPDYDGIPYDNHQCYKIINPKIEMCFDRESRSNCRSLGYGETAFYLLHPVNGNSVIADVDLRLHFEIYSGEADIYIARSPSAYQVKYNAQRGEYDVTVDRSYEASKDNTYPTGLGRLRKKRYSNTPASVKVDDFNIEEIEESVKDKYALYYTFNSENYAVLKLTGVTYTSVIIFPASRYNFGQQRFYVIIKSRAHQTTGKLMFHQEVSQPHALVVISVLVSCLLLILCVLVIVWKIKVMHMIRELQQVRQVQLIQMAERPVSSKILYLDMEEYYYYMSRQPGTSSAGARYMPYNVVPLALEPISKTNTVVATVFMLMPGDETRPMKAALASTLLTWKLSFPPTTKRVRPAVTSSTTAANASSSPEIITTETSV